MKKFLAVLLVLVLCLMTAASAELAGGWTVTEDPAMTEEATAAFDTAMSEFVGADYEPIALLATQVVAGVNYCILCRTTLITATPVNGYALVYIYADLSGGAEVLGVTDIDGIMIGELKG